MAETPTAIVTGQVDLPAETVQDLIEHSAFAVRVLTALRDRMFNEIGTRGRITTPEVMRVLDMEIKAYDAGTSPDAWRRTGSAM